MMKKSLLFSILVLVSFSCMRHERKNQAEFHQINSLSNDTYNDLFFLNDDLKDKRIVQIGESGHGMAEYFKLKTRLVKYLHQELGYNVIAVEGSLGDCSSAFMNIGSLNDTILMKNCFYSAWNFKEALPLFSYIKSTQKSDNPLILTGFDNISTGHYFPVFFKEVLAKIDTTKAKTFEYVDYGLSKFTNGGINKDNFEEQRKSILDSLLFCKKLVLNNGELIRNQFSESEHIVELLIKSLDNIRSTMSIEKDEYSRETMERMRDAIMAENLIWLADSVYNGEKIIVWAHNAHVSKSYSKISGLDSPFKRQGEYVHEKFTNQVFTIGVYGYEGTAWAFFINKEYNFTPPSESSLEAQMKQSGYATSYLNLDKISNNDSLLSWVYDTIPSYEWGRFEHRIVPVKHYNGIILIDKISPPTKISESNKP